MIEAIGHFFFRTRNVLFPVLLVVVLAIFGPRPLFGVTSLSLMYVGFVVLAIGQGLRVATIGLDYIQRGGKNGRIYASRLVTGGLFGECRNPMYTGNVLMALGFFMISGNPYAAVVGGVLAFLVYSAIIASEEGYLRQEFGAGYADYCADTPRWLPRPSGVVNALRGHDFDWAAVVIREYGTLFTTAVISLAIIGWRAALTDDFMPHWLLFAGIFILLLLAWGLARYLKKSRRLRAGRKTAAVER